jgi:hypothetical protein
MRSETHKSSEIHGAQAQTGPAGLIFTTVLNPGWVSKSSVNLNDAFFKSQV